jgi:stage II sporulation SpoAA-like protein
MIELIHGLPNNVVGITTRGRVTREDWADVLLPAIDEALRRNEKVRLYYEIASRYPGAGWDALDLATDRLERIAVVSDAAWVKWVATALCFLIAGDVRIFTKEEEEDGISWITAPNSDLTEFPDTASADISPSRQRSRRAKRRRHPKTLIKTPIGSAYHNGQ